MKLLAKHCSRYLPSSLCLPMVRLRALSGRYEPLGRCWWLLVAANVLHTWLLFAPRDDTAEQAGSWVAPVTPLGDDDAAHLAAPGVDCDAIVRGRAAAVKRAEHLRAAVPPLNDSHLRFMQLAADCATLKVHFGFQLSAGSPNETRFPLAFGILMHDDAWRLLHLLALIYQPQNLYCVHVDAKSSPQVHEAVHTVAACFANVVLAQPVAVVYASVDRLLADLSCLRQLASNPFYEWRYAMNLVNQDFPLRTNWELVQILQSFGGANDVEGLYNRRIKRRYEYSWTRTKPAADCKLDDPVAQYDCRSDYLSFSGQLKSPPPALMSIVRGSAYGAFSHEFVRFVLFESRHARLLLNWSRDTYSPDEHYWATLNFLKVNPHLGSPGGYTGTPHQKRWFAKYVQWGLPCTGVLVRGVCVFGLRDVPALVRRREFFANKVSTAVQWPTHVCLARCFRQRLLLRPAVNASHYSFV